MANIKVTIDYPIVNGQPLTFRSPADCSKVTGLVVYYPEGGTNKSKTFQFADAHGNNVGSIDLFAANVLVKVILDTEANRAYVQNADTNAYLERRFEGKANNPNLLDNWYFADPINQRGKTEYRQAGYTVDRWSLATNDMALSLTSGGLSFVKTGGTRYQYFSQMVEVPSGMNGQVCTLSARINTPNYIALRVYSNVITGGGLASSGFAGLDGVATLTFTVPDDAETLHILFYPHNYDEVTEDATTLIAAKLELGSEQTLARQENGNWVLIDPPPDKGMELLKCIQSTADSSDTYANKVVYHTGNKPTAADVGALKLYGSFEELGLTEATATVEGIVNAMVNGSMLMVNCSTAGVTSGLLPSSHGLLTVERRNNYFTSFEYRNGSGFWRGYYNAASGSGIYWSDWKMIATTDYAVNKAGDTMTGALTLPSLQCTALTTPTKIGRYLDFHYTDQATRTARLMVAGDGSGFIVNIPSVGDYTMLHTGNVTAGTTDITAGSALATGSFYDVYE